MLESAGSTSQARHGGGNAGRQAILAKVVIDTTGDGDVAARAGLPFVKGREEDGAMRPATVMGRIGNIDLHRFKAYIDAHPQDFSQHDGRRADLKPPD